MVCLDAHYSIPTDCAPTGDRPDGHDAGWKGGAWHPQAGLLDSDIIITTHCWRFPSASMLQSPHDLLSRAQLYRVLTLLCDRSGILCTAITAGASSYARRSPRCPTPPGCLSVCNIDHLPVTSSHRVFSCSGVWQPCHASPGLGLCR